MMPPRLSIIIVAWNSAEYLRACLTSLAPQYDATTMEVIVATNLPPDDCARLGVDFPFVRLVYRQSVATVPQLRSAGVDASQGEIVAITEDHLAFAPQWCAEISKAHDLPYAVIGGSVDNGGPQSLLDWAVYFYDYGSYMPPGAPGVVESLSGANVSYKRPVLEEIRAQWADGFYEAFVYSALLERGHALYLHPAAIVVHTKRYQAGPAFGKAYHLARAFAGLRGKQWPFWRRVAFGCGAVALPAILTLRIVVAGVKKKKRLGKLLASFPFLLPLVSTWALGEMAGYWCGAGGSGAKWR